MTASKPHHGDWTDAFSQEAVGFDAVSSLRLPAWGWRVLTR